jgi:hypothetical protein
LIQDVFSFHHIKVELELVKGFKDGVHIFVIFTLLDD